VRKGTGVKKYHWSQVMVVAAAAVAHTFNPSTQEAEAGGLLSLRPAWSTERVP
jgi:major histocompatibility complex class I